MRELKFKVLSKFKTPLPLGRASRLCAFFEYEDGRELMKSNIELTSPEIGEGKLSLSDFEIQGLKLGKGQPFILQFSLDGKVNKVLFSNALDVIEIEGRKSII